ncbi:hypothetical protein [Vibrio harveyi]|uniref:hypothetical protein n=1 Tax=Vibrio harveyi TaxID=669 RepID=UPI00390AA5B8
MSTKDKNTMLNDLATTYDQALKGFDISTISLDSKEIFNLYYKLDTDLHTNIHNIPSYISSTVIGVALEQIEVEMHKLKIEHLRKEYVREMELLKKSGLEYDSNELWKVKYEPRRQQLLLK